MKKSELKEIIRTEIRNLKESYENGSLYDSRLDPIERQMPDEEIEEVIENKCKTLSDVIDTACFKNDKSMREAEKLLNTVYRTKLINLIGQNGFDSGVDETKLSIKDLDEYLNVSDINYKKILCDFVATIIGYGLIDTTDYYDSY